MSNVNEFLTMQQQDPSMILFSQMEVFGDTNNLKIELFKLGNTTDYSYNFIYPETKYNNREFIFSFGVRY
jgi:hypothetical protein